MTILLYDGSFDGLFTAIFEVFEYRYNDVEIKNRENFHQEALFSEVHEVITQKEKSERVLNKLEQNIGKSGINQLLKVFYQKISKWNNSFYLLSNNPLNIPTIIFSKILPTMIF